MVKTVDGWYGGEVYGDFMVEGSMRLGGRGVAWGRFGWLLRRWPPNCYFALSALSRNELATAAMTMARIARDISSFVGVR